MNEKTTKKSTPKKQVPSKPKLCLRQIDKSTQLMSDDAMFPEVLSPKSEPLPTGHVRVDDSTVVKGELGPKMKTIKPGAKKAKK
jgi:hypothetical protein